MHGVLDFHCGFFLASLFCFFRVSRALSFILARLWRFVRLLVSVNFSQQDVQENPIEEPYSFVFVAWFAEERFRTADLRLNLDRKLEKTIDSHVYHVRHSLRSAAYHPRGDAIFPKCHPSKAVEQ